DILDRPASFGACILNLLSGRGVSRRRTRNEKKKSRKTPDSRLSSAAEIFSSQKSKKFHLRAGQAQTSPLYAPSHRHTVPVG
ncbi:hypothetical protein JS562_48925, partial [Agrobacterium sp. S2]|nr:hypothetical protein [Agrobacterium sp. S2]